MACAAQVTAGVTSRIAATFPLLDQRLTSGVDGPMKSRVKPTTLMAVILGGMGKIPGVILGAFIVILAPELLRDFGDLRLLIFAVGLLLIMLFRPSGIWPAGSRR